MNIKIKHQITLTFLFITRTKLFVTNMINFETVTERTSLLSSFGIFTAVHSQKFDQTFIWITEFYNTTECSLDKAIFRLKNKTCCLNTHCPHKKDLHSLKINTHPPPPLKKYHSGNRKTFRTVTGVLNGFSEKYLYQLIFKFNIHTSVHR